MVFQNSSVFVLNTIASLLCLFLPVFKKKWFKNLTFKYMFVGPFFGKIKKLTCSALLFCLFFIASNFEQMLFHSNKQDTSAILCWSANTKPLFEPSQHRMKDNDLKMVLSQAVNYFQSPIKDKAWELFSRSFQLIKPALDCSQEKQIRNFTFEKDKGQGRLAFVASFVQALHNPPLFHTQTHTHTTIGCSPFPRLLIIYTVHCFQMQLMCNIKGGKHSICNIFACHIGFLFADLSPQKRNVLI